MRRAVILDISIEEVNNSNITETDFPIAVSDYSLKDFHENKSLKHTRRKKTEDVNY